MVSKARFKNLTIEGARTNNLKDISLSLPLGKITCIYGPSGSGKSSLAFGTLVDESKRRFINSLPNDIKFLWNIPPSADVDLIEPVLPVWSLAQLNPVVGSRPVVSDLLGVTELITRFYTLNASSVCRNCGGKIVKTSLLDHIENWVASFADESIFHFLINKEVYSSITSTGFPARSCKGERAKILEFSADHEYWEVSRSRKKQISAGIRRVLEFLGAIKSEILIKVEGSQKFTKFIESNKFCENCGEVFTSTDFSPDKFNPLIASGACTSCDGFGQILNYDLGKIVRNESLTLEEGAIPLLTYKQFSHLLGDLKKDLKAAKINPNIAFSKMPKLKWKILEKGGKYFCGLEGIYEYLERKKYKRSIRILSRRLKSEKNCETCEATRLFNGKIILIKDGKDLRSVYKSNVSELHTFFNKKKSSDLSYEKLKFLLETAQDLGLGNLFLNRKVKSLSSGEYQRLLLVKILAQSGTGMLFVLDEPSRGLSNIEQCILIEKLRLLKEQGNTILIVDHSNFIQLNSDFLIKMGPGAGTRGGEVMEMRKIVKPFKPDRLPKEKNLKIFKSYVEFSNVEILERKIKKVKLPLNNIVWITGNSGTGKSLFFKYVMYNHLEYTHTGIKTYDLKYSFERFHTTNVISKVNYFDPELRSGSSRSTVGTYLGFSEIVRKHFSSLDISKKIGYEPGHFSPNSDLGKCLTCEGRGSLEIDMQFLENLTIKCEDCDGKKIKKEISIISDGNMTVDEAYNSPLEEVLSYYRLTPKFYKLFEYTKILNLSHLSLSRTLKSLSGGERLRLQFLKSLNLKSSGELFIFDNLSIGLSEQELESMTSILLELRSKKNTIVIIDSNPFFSKICNHTINFNNL